MPTKTGSKVQFNSNTLKAAYDAVERKAIVFSCPSCYTCGRFTISFEGVTNCNCEECADDWPSDLNNVNVTIPFTRQVGGDYIWCGSDNGWTIIIICREVGDSVYFMIFALYPTSYIPEEFEYCLAFASGYSSYKCPGRATYKNDISIGHCCGWGRGFIDCNGSEEEAGTNGYGGIAHLSWDDEGC